MNLRKRELGRAPNSKCLKPLGRAGRKFFLGLLLNAGLFRCIAFNPHGDPACILTEGGRRLSRARDLPESQSEEEVVGLQCGHVAL